MTGYLVTVKIASQNAVMSQVKRKSKTKQYHHGDLRQALLDGALALIEEAGISALSLREVARRIGVSHAAPYHHFEDRSALLCAVAEQGFVAMHEAMVQAVRAAGQSPIQSLQAIGIAYVQFAAGNPSQFRVMFSPDVVGEKQNAALKSASSATFQRLSEGLVAAGLSETKARDAALLAWSTVHGSSMLWIDHQLTMPEAPPDVAAFAKKVVRMLTKSLKMSDL